MSELSAADPTAEKAVEGGAASPPANPFFKPGQQERLPQRAAMERLTLDAGPVVLTWPAELDQDSVKDFEYWVRGIIRRARRKAGLPPEEES